MLVNTLLPNYNVLSMVNLGENHYKIWERKGLYAVSLESHVGTEIFHFDNYKAAETKYIALLKG